MSNRTLPRPTQQRMRAKPSKREAAYKRQTARVGGRRDGKPLIFGWGGHLTRAQKTRVQRMSAYGFFGLVVVAILGVVVFGVLNENVFIPNATIASVNAVNIPQDSYRKLLDYDAQVLWNTLQSEINQQNALQTKVQQGDSKAAQQNALLTTEISSNESSYQQAQITAQAAQELVENQLIVQGAQQFERQDHVPASTFTPTSAQVTAQLNKFKAAFPANESYKDFLSQDNLSEQDVRDAITLHLRRDMMQAFLASRLTSPTRQVHLRRIETSTAADAAKIRNQLVNQHASWNTLAKQDSLDPDSKNKGGDIGWVPPGTGDAGIELWAYASGRKVGDISPVIKDAAGTYDVVQVLGIDPSRAVDSSLLSAAKSNALDHWLSGQKVDPSNHLTTPNADMVNASRNLPKLPNLNATLPTENTQSSPSLTTP